MYTMRSNSDTNFTVPGSRPARGGSTSTVRSSSCDQSRPSNLFLLARVFQASVNSSEDIRATKMLSTLLAWMFQRAASTPLLETSVATTRLKLDASGIVKLPFPQYSSSKSWLPLELDELVLAAPLLLLARAAGDGAAAAPAVLPVGAGPRESTCPACTSAAGGGGAAVVSVGAGSCAAVCPVCAAAGSVPLAAPDPSTPAALCSAAA
mmetsp:Transcript_14337/g.38872  ORF Transcript_14337/g.38872 Transcript_14337/m.38872 type:complete len:208 (-) Transcript_14337:908-1531(-)